MTPSQGRIALIATAIVGLLAGFGLAHELDRRPPVLASGTWLPSPKQVGDFRLEDTGGHPFTRAQLAGRPHLVFFGFTHCPDVCPATLAMLSEVSRAHGLPAQVLFVTVDPQRDTLPHLATYVHAFDPGFVGLTGDQDTIARLARQFGVVVSKVPLPGGDYTMDHSAVLFLLSAQGQIVSIFTPPFDAQRLKQDLKLAAPLLGGDS
jgi:protein SCO1/2